MIDNQLTNMSDKMKPSEKILEIYDKYLTPERENNELAKLKHMVSSIMHYLDKEAERIK